MVGGNPEALSFKNSHLPGRRRHSKNLVYEQILAEVAQARRLRLHTHHRALINSTGARRISSEGHPGPLPQPLTGKPLEMTIRW